jgi:hypothetical protein
MNKFWFAKLLLGAQGNATSNISLMFALFGV